jgi:hypothetical protein
MEEVLPPLTEQGAGYEPSQVRQFTVYMENRVGRLQQLVRTYEQAGGSVIALMVQNSADTALVRLICSDGALAHHALTRAGYSFTEQQLLLVELGRQRQEPLASLAAVLLAAEINIHYAYPLLVPPHGPSLALYVEDAILAGQVLIRKGYRLIGESDLGPGR